MFKIGLKTMEKIMHVIIMLFLWSSVIMGINSCMPIDISSPPFLEENFAPIIVSATPNNFNGPYTYSQLDSNKLVVKLIDLNTTDTLTLGWYVKDINNQLEVPYKLSSIRKATDDETSTDAIFTFELKEDYLVCGLNRVILLVSDRGLKEGGLSGDSNFPYPSQFEILKDEINANKVKINMREWIIRKECSK